MSINKIYQLACQLPKAALRLGELRGKWEGVTAHTSWRRMYSPDVEEYCNYVILRDDRVKLNVMVLSDLARKEGVEREEGRNNRSCLKFIPGKTKIGDQSWCLRPGEKQEVG